ncbi:MAG: hypothetical protein A2722_01395 [Candidatus Doudnabacteria bacterium RIFCSPHIGHO2_01_FULL_50_11]|uniref:Uncharacterized protein n=1 Tax=Candidatus Doudnabacteria bacterium RIFCSPHIGHO2_01_FULL_50_11 TaxID=1817828 RepID=A0A1F5PH86_9BACT|nr:MAG: hypothetical protein A2722_01395 [Candidatus Doudnabacteria bacterium RIFCSPHIGHO2_01_FULL_50_11]HLC44822.1 hypothetical protein [Patescibacteria group bacterium]
MQKKKIRELEAILTEEEKQVAEEMVAHLLDKRPPVDLGHERAVLSYCEIVLADEIAKRRILGSLCEALTERGFTFKRLPK